MVSVLLYVAVMVVEPVILLLLALFQPVGYRAGFHGNLQHHINPRPESLKPLLREQLQSKDHPKPNNKSLRNYLLRPR